MNFQIDVWTKLTDWMTSKPMKTLGSWNTVPKIYMTLRTFMFNYGKLN